MELQDRPGTSSPATDVIAAAPWSDHDPYTDETLLDPWPGYQHLREAGPAVWLRKCQMFALTRYDSVRRALEDWESFPSRNGVMMNDRMNQVLRGNTLCSDGPHLGKALSRTHSAEADSRQRLRDLHGEIRAGVAALQPTLDTVAGQQQMTEFLLGKTREVKAVVTEATSTSRSQGTIVAALGQRYGQLGGDTRGT